MDNPQKQQVVSPGQDPLSLLNSLPSKQSAAPPSQVQTRPPHPSQVAKTIDGATNPLMAGYFYKEDSPVKDQYSLQKNEVLILPVTVYEISKDELFGKLLVTNYRVWFREQKKEGVINEIQDKFSVPYGYFYRLKQINDKKSNYIEITTKDDRRLKFRFDSSYQFERAFDAINKRATVNNDRDFYSYDFSQPLAQEDGIGPKIIFSQVQKEFIRMGVAQRGDIFREFLVHQGGSYVKINYPDKVYVPSGITPDQVKGSSTVRIDGRFPTLAYYSEYYQSSIWRSSEPSFEIMMNRSFDDEDFLKTIALQSKIENAKLSVFSARPIKYDKESKYGQENDELYKNIKMVYYNQASNKQFHESYFKLQQFIGKHLSHKASKQLSKLEKGRYMHAVEIALRASSLVAKNLINSRQNVLIHCVNGTDSSCVLSSLAQIFIDTHYRTIEGFKVLILKDWLYYGHNFRKASALMRTFTIYGSEQKPEDLPQLTPYFLLFLDCVHQLMVQNPTLFEFGEEVLCQLGYHLYSNKFGEFIYSQDQSQSGFASVWDNIEITVNPLFRNDNKYKVVQVTHEIRFWTAFWGRYKLPTQKVPQKYKPEKAISQLKAQIDLLKKEEDKNRIQLEKLKQMCNHNGIETP